MKSLCLNRIAKDMKEIRNFPLEGIGIISLDDDPKKYIVNIKIMTGVYEGYCVQLLLTFSDDYPLKPPKILIYPGQCLDNTYHHHIFLSNLKDEKGRCFHKFCFDLLENDFLPTSTAEYTGWNPSYTISSLLLQVQIFLSNPDFPTGYIPPENKINALMKSMDDYENIFLKNNKDNNNDDIIKHTWKSPYPPMFFKKEEVLEKSEKSEKIEKNDELKNDLTCYISRLNYIDDKNILLGYPLKKLKKNILLPIPEILSYDCFIEESTKNNNFFNYQHNTNNNEIISFENLFNFNFDRYLNNYPSFKSANNEFYEYWLPIFINEEHFKKNETTILNYFSIIKYGNSGEEKYDFLPQYIFEIMPNLLSNMIKKMSDGNISSSFIKCFFQYVLLYKKLKEKYNNAFLEYQKSYFEKKFENFKKNTTMNLTKEILEMLIIFFCSNNENNINNIEIKNKIDENLNDLKRFLLFKFLENDESFNCISNDEFVESLKEQKLFNKIAGIIIFDTYDFLAYKKDNFFLFGILADKVILRMTNDFRLLFNELPLKMKNKIKNILINEFIFPEHLLFEKNRIDSYNFVLGYGYASNFYIYKAILIFEILRKKILSKLFLEKLENNFGIFTKTESLIHEINEIKRSKVDKVKNLEYFKCIEKLIDINNKIKHYSFDFFEISFDELYENIVESDLFYDREEKYPFVKIYEINGIKRVLISKNIQIIFEERKNISVPRAKFIKFLHKKQKELKKLTQLQNRINNYKRRKDRINIKNSYDNNLNKRSKKKKIF